MEKNKNKKTKKQNRGPCVEGNGNEEDMAASPVRDRVVFSNLADWKVQADVDDDGEEEREEGGHAQQRLLYHQHSRERVVQLSRKRDGPKRSVSFEPPI